MLRRHELHSVRDLGVVDPRHDGRVQVFQSLEPVERLVGLHADELDRGIQFLQASSRAHHRAGGAEAGDEMRDPPVGLAPQLLGSREVMRPWIGRVIVLVRVPEVVRPAGGEPARRADRAVRALEGVGEEHLRAERLQQRLPLGARVGGHTNRDADPGRSTEHCVGDGRIAARGVEQPLAGQHPLRDAVAQDKQGRPVLHRAAWVEPLGLEKDGW